jgi:hypothetical protein
MPPMGEAKDRRERDPEEPARRALSSRVQFLRTHLLVLSGPGPFGEKYLQAVADAIETHRASNPETEALRAQLLSRLEAIRSGVPRG